MRRRRAPGVSTNSTNGVPRPLRRQSSRACRLPRHRKRVAIDRRGDDRMDTKQRASVVTVSRGLNGATRGLRVARQNTTAPAVVVSEWRERDVPNRSSGRAFGWALERHSSCRTRLVLASHWWWQPALGRSAEGRSFAAPSTLSEPRRGDPLRAVARRWGCWHAPRAEVAGDRLAARRSGASKGRGGKGHGDVPGGYSVASGSLPPCGEAEGVTPLTRSVANLHR